VLIYNPQNLQIGFPWSSDRLAIQGICSQELIYRDEDALAGVVARHVMVNLEPCRVRARVHSRLWQVRSRTHADYDQHKSLRLRHDGFTTCMMYQVKTSRPRIERKERASQLRGKPCCNSSQRLFKRKANWQPNRFVPLKHIDKLRSSLHTACKLCVGDGKLCTAGSCTEVCYSCQRVT